MGMATPEMLISDRYFSAHLGQPLRNEYLWFYVLSLCHVH